MTLTLSPQSEAAAGAFLCAFAVSLLIVVTKRHHGHLSLDSTIGIQKIHVDPTPRIGGLAIYAGLFFAFGLVRQPAVRHILSVLLLAGSAALACGLAEDLTKRVGVFPRLVATMAGGALACWMTGIAVNRLEVNALDWLLATPATALLFTVFAVGGVANAINIIDGFHGLACGTSIIALLALAAIAQHAGDAEVAFACISLAAAAAGFLVVNYPFGKLFMGDGGAYFLGFGVAWLAVLLPMRNPNVSVWAPLLVCVYPVIEVLYSIARRSMRRRSAAQPDCEHLHSLIEQELIRKRWNISSGRLANAVVAPTVLSVVWVPAALAVAAYDRAALLATAAVACLLLYHAAYSHLARRARVSDAEKAWRLKHVTSRHSLRSRHSGHFSTRPAVRSRATDVKEPAHAPENETPPGA